MRAAVIRDGTVCFEGEHDKPHRTRLHSSEVLVNVRVATLCATDRCVCAFATQEDVEEHTRVKHCPPAIASVLSLLRGNDEVAEGESAITRDVPGFYFAGVVDEVGVEVTRFAIGDHVVGA